MARIEGVAPDRAGLIVRLAYWMSQRLVGEVTEPLTIAARHSSIFRAYGAYELFLGRARHLDAKLKALASVKAATMIGCPF